MQEFSYCGKSATLDENGHVTTLEGLAVVCEYLGESIAQNANQTFLIDREGPFTLENWNSLASPYYAEGFDEYRMIPREYRSQAIALIRKAIADWGISDEVWDLIRSG